jgi:butyrate kinase
VGRRVEWIAPVFVHEREDELAIIAESALRALAGEDPPRRYR